VLGFFVTCEAIAITRRQPIARSIAPPMPMTVPPGTAVGEVAAAETCIATRIVARSTDAGIIATAAS